VSDKILCIGGVVDGLRTRDSGPDAFFQEPMSLDALSRIDFTEPAAKIRTMIDQGWDHVSVSLPNRCPNWQEMCFIKDVFFDAHECAMQLHPPKSENVNLTLTAFTSGSRRAA
jgi:hypothetical protein